MNFERALKDASEKVTKAMRLFSKCDDTYKRIIVHTTGYAGDGSPESLRTHFDTLDLMDGLDMLIFDMEDEIESSQ